MQEGLASDFWRLAPWTKAVRKFRVMPAHEKAMAKSEKIEKLIRINHLLSEQSQGPGRTKFPIPVLDQRGKLAHFNLSLYINHSSSLVKAGILLLIHHIYLQRGCHKTIMVVFAKEYVKTIRIAPPHKKIGVKGKV